MDRTMVSIGLFLIAVSTVVMFATGVQGTPVPDIAAAAAAVGLTAGTLVVGTSKSRQV